MDQLSLDTQFTFAVLSDNYNETLKLIKMGANINIVMYNNCALYNAIYNERRHINSDNETIADLLLKHNATITNKVIDYVISADLRNSLKKLIYYGADVNKTKSLIYASYLDYLHIVRILLQSNADITMVDRYGNNSLILACELDKPNAFAIIKDLCTVASNKYIDIINHVNNHGETALDLVKNQEIKEFLVSKGAKSFKKIKDSTCDICIYEKINMIIEPCKHMICNLCLSKINKCPFCRGEIENKILI